MNADTRTGLKANPKYKDTVFSLLFNDNPEAAVEVSNTFLGTHFPAGTKVIFKTLKNVLINGRINDLAFILEGRLIILVEHQSTLNQNMPYRMLQYIAETYKNLNDKDIEYRDKKFLLQRPKFIVLYNGERKMKEDIQILRLSDMYIPASPEDGVIDLELTVKMYNITEGRNKDMVSRCATLQEYSIFIIYTQ
ncbi:MAG: Rpn family recombination-promoting nuclease/putative transposase [Chitinispirillia bacterium]|nr:Rpn family recombination-promoting nuclease/putative transposase [Chitinispirillia bacterium]